MDVSRSGHRPGQDLNWKFEVDDIILLPWLACQEHNYAPEKAMAVVHGQAFRSSPARKSQDDIAVD